MYNVYIRPRRYFYVRSNIGFRPPYRTIHLTYRLNCMLSAWQKYHLNDDVEAYTVVVLILLLEFHLLSNIQQLTNTQEQDVSTSRPLSTTFKWLVSSWPKMHTKILPYTIHSIICLWRQLANKMLATHRTTVSERLCNLRRKCLADPQWLCNAPRFLKWRIDSGWGHNLDLYLLNSYIHMQWQCNVWYCSS